MGYNIKDVSYLSNLQEYTNAYTASQDSVQPIDVSAYVDPIARGKAKGQGLAVYRVSTSISADDGSPCLAAETASFTMGLSIKPYTTTGEQLSGAIAYGDLSASNDLLIYGKMFTGAASAAPGFPTASDTAFLEPTPEVPYVVVRDTIFQIMGAAVAFNADVLCTVRMETAMITLDQSTLNQLLRTQTA
jgi:hypothetical protein